MRKIKLFGLSVALFAVMFVMQVWAADQSGIGTDKKNNILVEINYGNDVPSKKVEVSVDKDRTILEVLQSVAEVKTCPVGEYVMVTAIDGIENNRGQMGWYYMLDGKLADKIAFSELANNVKSITWLYKEDVCSRTVDSDT